MNKFEKLIEYIINDEDQKARELFHDIVVEKSRDIYESIMDEESMGEEVHGDQVGDMVDEISHEESVGEGDDEFGGEEELGGEEHGDEFGGEEGGEEEFGSEQGEHAEIEDQVMNIDAKLDELLAKFDEIMGDEGHGEEMPAEEPGMEHSKEEFGGEEEQGMMEGENPFASGKSGKSGSAMSGKSGKSGSGVAEAFGKSGSALSGKSGKSGSAQSGKSGSAKSGKSGKGSAELMREYVDKIQDMNLTGETEGTSVGAAGKKVSVNTKAGSVGPGADFGGTSKNLNNGGAEEAADGKAIPKPSNEYNKGEGKLPGAGKFENVPGAKAKQTSTGEEYSKEHPKDGSGAGAKDTGLGRQNTKSVQKQNTGIKR